MSEENNKTFSQEELNSIVSDRLNKEKSKYEKQIEELTAKTNSYEQQIANFTSQLEEINKKAATSDEELKAKESKIQEYESAALKMRIAHEFEIPYELANRLSGNTEEEIKADAEVVKKLLGTTKGYAPMKTTEDSASESNLDSAFRQFSRQLQK